jgi:ring-1,2-phenylacetyl-CoA epoxidase subunit PaaD
MVTPLYDKAHIHQLLDAVSDPEIPVLSVNDLGIVRDVIIRNNDAVEIIITPTYSGCPAMDMIAMQIKSYLNECGYDDVKVTSVLSPGWTTEWMTDSGKQKLEQFGIAPPVRMHNNQNAPRRCPHCLSTNTEVISQFGSTSCKALYKCKDCLEPFDYFKCH